MNAGQRVCAPLRQQPVVGEVARLVDVFAVLAVLGVDGVGGHQDGRLWRTVVLVVQDGLLHLGKTQCSVFRFSAHQSNCGPLLLSNTQSNRRLAKSSVSGWFCVYICTRSETLRGVFAVCYLQEEEPLRHFLDELLGHVLREELGSELKLQRVLLLHILLGHLEGRNNTVATPPLMSQ